MLSNQTDNRNTQNKELVSVIVPTKNSAPFLRRCLESIKHQTYIPIEIIVVDNFSTDQTKEIALEYTSKFYEKGPERSAQVNYGVEVANGFYVYKVDSDFVLDPKVVEQCVDKMKENYDAVVVHNTPDETISYLARVRKFEVDMYKYSLANSAARFLKKSTFIELGGFDANVTAGEDYDFQNKINRKGLKTGFVDAEAVHLGEPKSFVKLMHKYYLYGKDFVNYSSTNDKESSAQLSFIRKDYIKNWKKFLMHPVLGISFIFYHFFKYAFTALGFFSVKPTFFIRIVARQLKFFFMYLFKFQKTNKQRIVKK